MSQSVDVNFHSLEDAPVEVYADHSYSGMSYWLTLSNADKRTRVTFFADSAAELYRVGQDLSEKILAAVRTLPLPGKEPPQTTAQKIARRFKDDGITYRDADGIHLGDICQTEPGVTVAKELDGDFETYRYTFADGSVLTLAESGWDFGYADCFCWEGAGHTEECLSKTAPAPDDLAF